MARVARLRHSYNCYCDRHQRCARSLGRRRRAEWRGKHERGREGEGGRTASPSRKAQICTGGACLFIRQPCRWGAWGEVEGLPAFFSLVCRPPPSLVLFSSNSQSSVLSWFVKAYMERSKMCIIILAGKRHVGAPGGMAASRRGGSSAALLFRNLAFSRQRPRLRRGQGGVRGMGGGVKEKLLHCADGTYPTIK